MSGTYVLARAVGGVSFVCVPQNAVMKSSGVVRVYALGIFLLCENVCVLLFGGFEFKDRFSNDLEALFPCALLHEEPGDWSLIILSVTRLRLMKHAWL